MDISVSLEVYKALTQRLTHEAHSYDDVIRELLQLDSPLEVDFPMQVSEPFGSISDGMARATDPTSFHSRGLRLPHGTALKARYKGDVYDAKIDSGEFVGGNGQRYTSPSAAASAITNNNVNGLRFWEAMRPGDVAWRRLDTLVRR